MPKYRCKVCANELDVKFPPFACPACKAKGKGFTEVTSAAAAPSPLPTEPTGPKSIAEVVAAGAKTVAPPPPPPPPPPPEKIVSPVIEAPPREPERAAPPPPPPLPPPPPPVRPQDDRIVARYAPPPPADGRTRPLRGCPAVDAAGRMFVCMQNRLLMFAPGAAAPQWEYATAGMIPRSPAIGSDGHVRIHSADGFLHLVDVDGRSVCPPVAVGEALGSASPLVDHFNNTWICRHDGGLIRIDAAGQTTSRPFYRTRRRFDCTGLIAGDVLYIGCEDHYLYAVPLSADVGANAWTDSPERGRTGCAINGAVARGRGPLLLVAGHDDHLHAFDLDGAELWSMPLPGQVLGSPVVDENGTIYLGLAQNPRNQTPRGLLAAVDGGTHQIKWRYDTAAPVESTPVIGDDGVVYFGDNDGIVHAVDPQGRQQWETTLAAPVRSAGAIVGPGRLAFGLDDGSLVVLQCSSQKIRSGGWPKLQGSATQSGLASIEA